MAQSQSLEFHLLSSWFGPRKFYFFPSPSACLHFTLSRQAVFLQEKNLFCEAENALEGVGQELTVPPAWWGQVTKPPV